MVDRTVEEQSLTSKVEALQRTVKILGIGLVANVLFTIVEVTLLAARLPH